VRGGRVLMVVTEPDNPDGDLPREGTARTLPRRRLPSRFLLSLDTPSGVPAFAEPSATLVLLRGSSRDFQVLLLKRTPRSGFIPGTWVFPGGRVDETDHHREILDRIDGMDGAVARERLDLDAEEPPALAYWVAAIRETFDETGVLPSTGMDPAGLSTLQDARRRLLAGESSFQEILEEIGLRLDASALAYVGHWITPECEPRRYQTRFFLTTTNGEMPVLPHQEELVDHLWLSPTEALARNRNGSLPLVLPTLVTLEELAPFSTAQEAVSRLGALPVPRRMPVPSRTEGGFRFALPR